MDVVVDSGSNKSVWRKKREYLKMCVRKEKLWLTKNCIALGDI